MKLTFLFYDMITPFSTIFQLWWSVLVVSEYPEKTTDLSQITGKLYQRLSCSYIYSEHSNLQLHYYNFKKYYKLGNDWDFNNRFNPSISLCMSQDMILISIATWPGNIVINRKKTAEHIYGSDIL